MYLIKDLELNYQGGSGSPSCPGVFSGWPWRVWIFPTSEGCTGLGMAGLGWKQGGGAVRRCQGRAQVVGGVDWVGHAASRVGVGEVPAPPVWGV